MVAPTYQYQVYHPVSRLRMGQLNVRGAKWTEVVNGGTTFTGKVTVPDNPVVAANIRNNTTPYGAAIYATPGGGTISFGGPIINRDWDSEGNTLTITAIDWKTWFYRVLLGPKTATMDPWVQTFTGVDQLTIAKAMIDRVAVTDNPGVPAIDTASYTTGVNRNYIITGMDFRSLGEYLDDLGGLANGGYEWEVEPYYASDGYPRPRVQFYIPQRGGVVAGLLFSKTPNGGNILKIDEMSDDASAVASRVWAVGEGPNAESTPWGNDTDPTIALGATLRTDQATKYSGALTVAQLASYARTERMYRSQYLSGLAFTVRLDSPDFRTYGKGDRCRVIVQDRFLNINVSKCRILSREIDPDSNTAKITVNLNDLTLPEVDSGGTV